jgi:hypothetical protein
VTIALIDRRYGGVLKNGPHKGLSATHAEIICARSLKKPIFFFIRRAAYQEYDQMRRNGWSMKSAWVEPDVGPDPNPRRELWFRFVEEIASYPPHQGWSNWCDQFENSVDLKAIVLKRLLDKYPRQSSVLALRPERLVRLSFAFLGSHQNGAIRGYYAGPALDIRHGFRRDNALNVQFQNGGLATGARLCPTDNGLTYSSDNGQGNAYRALFCAYRNAYGDSFRVETPLVWLAGVPTTPGPERFFVGHPGIDELAWIEVP